jgi:hypothetical protein
MAPSKRKIWGKKKAGPKKSGGITWDKHHCNPRAEIILVSEDMIGFRVDVWYMTQKR